MAMTTIEFKRADGQPAQGILAEAEQALGAVVVIQEWWGVNDQIRGVAQRLAAAGFTALVPDLYRGKSTLAAEEAHHLMNALNFGDAAANDVRGAIQHLKGLRAGSGKVGVTGFCMGGALTWLTLANAPEADAGVAWYGYPPLEYLDVTQIKRPVMAHWATQDAAFAIANVETLEARLHEAKVRYEGHRYLAHHAFANEDAQGSRRIAITQYDAIWAQVAWDRTLRFFGQHLT